MCMLHGMILDALWCFMETWQLQRDMIVLFPSFQVLLGPVLTSDETVGNNIHTFEENIPPAMFREPNGIKLKQYSTKQLSCNCWQLVPTWYAMPNKSE